MSRRIDYSRLPPDRQALLARAFFSTFERPTPKAQLAAAIGLVVGLCGFDLLDGSLDPTDSEREHVDELLAQAADAVLEVLARDGAKLFDVGGTDGP